MSIKKFKLLSGLLSVTALAAMTGAPVLANETVQTGLSMKGMTDESASDADASGELASQASGSGLMKSMTDVNESAGQTEESESAVSGLGVTVDQSSAEQAASSEGTNEKTASVSAETIEALAAPFADPAVEETVMSYNAQVLPEFKVALDKPVPELGYSAKAVLSGLSYSEEKPAAAEEKLVVASPNVYLNIHENPSLGSEVLGKMYGNDVAIELRKEDDRWTKVRSGNVVGFVLSDYLVEGKEAKNLSDLTMKQVARIKKDSDGDIYQAADEYSKVFAEAKDGDQYEVTESVDGWVGIMTDAGEGFIPASEVTLSMAYPVAESAREEAERVSKSNVKERADHEERKAEKAGAVAEVAQARANIASSGDEETATAVVEVALRAADAAAAQADVAKVAVSQAGEESGQAVIEFATQYIGNPYVWGGSSLTHGADCSGFVMAVYGNFGFRLPHYDVSDRVVGSPVASLEEARAGDIVCYNGHVALYMGDGMIVHAQDEQHGITTSRANFMNIVCIRRLFD